MSVTFALLKKWEQSPGEHLRESRLEHTRAWTRTQRRCQPHCVRSSERWMMIRTSSVRHRRPLVPHKRPRRTRPVPFAMRRAPTHRTGPPAGRGNRPSCAERGLAPRCAARGHNGWMDGLIGRSASIFFLTRRRSGAFAGFCCGARPLGTAVLVLASFVLAGA
jgi:hypothetical protein